MTTYQDPLKLFWGNQALEVSHTLFAVVVEKKEVIDKKVHTVNYDPFIKSQLASTQLTLGPANLVTLPPRIAGNETFLAHRVDPRS